MGLIALEKDDYPTAKKYFNKYRKLYLNDKDTLANFLTYSNNMGLVFQKEENYHKAYSYYKRITDLDNLEIEKPDIYARTSDNKAWCLFQENKIKLSKTILDKALLIRKQINDKPGLVMSYKHLSKYYLKENSLKKALDYAEEALKYCEETHNFKSKLEVLYLLSKIDPKKSQTYFKEYHQLKNELINKERKFKDQTARIRYETKEKEEQLFIKDAKLKMKNRIIIGALLASLLLALISIFIYRQKKYITQQKEAIESLQVEVHHTAKNNLDKAIVYLRQAVRNPSSEAFLALENRIKSMLKLHQLLYKTEQTLSDTLQEYIEEICAMLHKAYNDTNIEVQYNINANVVIEYKEVALIGIFVNELVTNIYKYAFTDQKKGYYSVTIQKIDDEVVLSVRDTGKGFPKDFNATKLKSYGLRLIYGIVVVQLKGYLSFHKFENENEVLIKFKTFNKKFNNDETYTNSRRRLGFI
jgi:two-component sensor histidine kinase